MRTLSSATAEAIQYNYQHHGTRGFRVNLRIYPYHYGYHSTNNDNNYSSM